MKDGLANYSTAEITRMDYNQDCLFGETALNKGISGQCVRDENLNHVIEKVSRLALWIRSSRPNPALHIHKNRLCPCAATPSKGDAAYLNYRTAEVVVTVGIKNNMLDEWYVLGLNNVDGLIKLSACKNVGRAWLTGLSVDSRR